MNISKKVNDKYMCVNFVLTFSFFFFCLFFKEAFKKVVYNSFPKSLLWRKADILVL